MTNQIFIVGKQFNLSERLKDYIFSSMVDLELDFTPMVCYCHVNLRDGKPLCEAEVIVHCHGHVLMAAHKAEVFYDAVDGAMAKMEGILENTRKEERKITIQPTNVAELVC